MFHRPKPATSNESQDAKKEGQKPQANADKKVANTNQTSLDLDKDTAATTTQTSTPKDTKDMSENKTESKDDEAKTAESSTTGTSSPFKKEDSSVPKTPGAYGTYRPTPYTPPSQTAAASAVSSASSPSVTPSMSSGNNGRRLVIGEGITMSGEIESCDHLLVEGTVEAALKGAKVLEISSTGVFYGTVEIEQATIAGRLEGDITVSGRLMIKSSGSVTGKLSYGELAVEAGGTLDGTLSPLNASSNRTNQGSAELSKKAG